MGSQCTDNRAHLATVLALVGLCSVVVDVCDSHLLQRPAPQAEEKTLGSIRQIILKGLGVKRVPDMARMNISQEEYAAKYEEYYERLSRSQAFPDVPKLYNFYPLERRPKRRPPTGVWRYVYNLGALPESAKPSEAFLRFLIPFLPGGQNFTFQIAATTAKGGRRWIARKDVSVEKDAAKWCEFDVSEALQQDLTAPVKYFEVELRCSQCTEARISAVSETEPPVLNVLAVEASRFRRSLQTVTRTTVCDEHNSKKCCRHKMVVDLKKLFGSNFIIQPTTIDAGFCKGRCPPNYNSANNHAILQTLLWKKDKTTTPRVCCAPSKLSSVNMLIPMEDDPNHLDIRHWTELVVEECACS